MHIYTKILFIIFVAQIKHLVKTYLTSYVCWNDKLYQMSKKPTTASDGLKRISLRLCESLIYRITYIKTIGVAKRSPKKYYYYRNS